MSVEVPLPVVTRAPLWSAFMIIVRHPISARIKHSLGIVAFVSRGQHGARIAPLGMMLHHKRTWIIFICMNLQEIIQPTAFTQKATADRVEGSIHIGWHTSCGLAHGLADTVQCTPRVAVEHPLSFVQRTAFRSVLVIFSRHPIGVGIQSFLGTVALLDSGYDCFRTAPPSVVMKLIPASCDAYAWKDMKKIIQLSHSGKQRLRKFCVSLTCIQY